MDFRSASVEDRQSGEPKPSQPRRRETRDCGHGAWGAHRLGVRMSMAARLQSDGRGDECHGDKDPSGREGYSTCFQREHPVIVLGNMLNLLLWSPFV